MVAGKTFDFSAFIIAGFVTTYFIGDFESTLFGSSGVVVMGISSARYLAGGFPTFDVIFPPIL